jgi:hypothetical protein
MQKMIWNPSKSAGANSETPNHAFALTKNQARTLLKHIFPGEISS